MSPAPRPQVNPLRIQRIVCHRWDSLKVQPEEYLVQWASNSPTSFYAYSWHPVDQLELCLPQVQQYIYELQDRRSQQQQKLLVPSARPGDRKRKSPSSDLISESPTSSQSGSSPKRDFSNKRRPEPNDFIICISSDDDEPELPAKPASRAQSENTRHALTYNGIIEITDGPEDGKLIQMNPWMTPLKPDQQLTSDLPTEAMLAHALNPRSITSAAEYAIQKAFIRKLAAIPGPPVRLDVSSTSSAPPLNFTFIDTNILGEGVVPADPAIQVGCGSYKEASSHGQQSCRPHMGAHQGCEYSRVCECLEYAPVDEPRLTATQRARLAAGDTMGLPKRFPYSGPNARVPYALSPFYLQQRAMIYECNARCACGPACKTRVVQRGRAVPLHIFRTAARGWGLRCPAPLPRGRFIDTYRGEVVTNAAAAAREAAAPPGAKDCYLYDLDKHELADGGGGADAADFYVVDGEAAGGPTRFMNHSCAPNCGQFTVSTNKHDLKVYELAFFALEDIPAGAELTFDYLDADADADASGDAGGDQDERLELQPGGSGRRVPCLCGAANCRKFLFT